MIEKLSASREEAEDFVEAERVAPIDKDRWLLAVHEAGHAAVAVSQGFVVKEVVLDRSSSNRTPGESWTELSEPDDLEDPDEAHLLVAIAGYANVGVRLGADAEGANKAADRDEPDSDLHRAYARLRSRGGTEAEMTEEFVKADCRVRDLLGNTWVGAAANEVADYLYRHGSIAGAGLRNIVDRTRPPVEPD
ncbi:MAG: hypothetical protein JJU45_19150 [Acidimicrobiia bacterium]|nr:hypothetical protein [Acidimicrobiia bacterium]